MIYKINKDKKIPKDIMANFIKSFIHSFIVFDYNFCLGIA